MPPVDIVGRGLLRTRRSTVKTKTIAIALGAIASVTALASITGAVVLASPGRGDVPLTRPSATSSLPAPSPSLSASPSPELSDFASPPTHITIRHGDTILIDTEIVPIALDDHGVLAPPPGKAGVYYSESDWNTIPGNLDHYRGIVAGHDVTGSRDKDVFYNLGEVKTGDTIVLTYPVADRGATATTATFAVTADARSAPKSDVVTSAEYEYLWQSKEQAGRYLSVLSCDLSQADPGQHSRNNWVVDAERVS